MMLQLNDFCGIIRLAPFAYSLTLTNNIRPQGLNQ